MQAPCQFVPCFGSVFIFFISTIPVWKSSSRVNIAIIPVWKPSSGSASTLILRKATNESRTATCGGVLEPNLYPAHR